MKKRRIFNLALVGVLCLSLLVGCASGQTDGDSEKLRVALVVNQRFGDNGPMDDLAAGARRAEADFGVAIQLLESSSAANFEDDIRAMAREGYHLIATTFPYMTYATRLIAEEFPDTMFAAIFQFVNMGGTPVPNIWDTEFHGQGAFYLAGYICGKLTQSNRIGLIIGAEEPTPNAEGNAFMRGVREANPDAAVDFSFVGSYEDPARAKEIANAMIANGCDILQTSAAASNAGVVEAALEAGVLVAGEITDFYNAYDGFVGIVGIGFGETLYAGIKDLLDGNFLGGQHSVRDLTNGGYFMDWASYERFANNSPEFQAVLLEGIAEAQEREQRIISGALVIDFDAEVPNWQRISQMF